MLWSEYVQLEDGKREALRKLERTDELLLVAARNDLETLALFRAALLEDRAIGIATKDVLNELDSARVQVGSDQLFVLKDKEVPGPRLACFTSGSTGNAKGILRTYDSWLRTYELQRKLLDCRRDAPVLILGNLAHSMHLYGAMEAFDRQVVPRVLRKFSSKLAVSACSSSRAEIIYATPVHLNLILAHAAKTATEPLEDVRLLLAGGAKLNEQHLDELQRVFPNAKIVEFFGTTETSYITIKQPGAPRGSVGKPCPGVSVKICDDEGNAVTAGAEGTLWVKSGMLFERYIAGEDANTQWCEGYVTVGDQGYLDDGGNLFFTARKGAMVTIAGENVFLDHIEARLRDEVPAGEAVVLSIDDALRGSRLIAVTQTRLPDAAADRALAALREAFGPLKAPRAIVHAPDWPFLASGKTDRRALKAQIAETV